MALLFAVPLWAQGVLSVVIEGTLAKPPGGPPPRWEDVIQEGLFKAVKETALSLGADQRVEEALRGNYTAFVVSFRILERRDLPSERQVSLEVGVNREGLWRYLASRGLLLGRGDKYLITVRGLEKYAELQQIEKLLGGFPSVLGFSLKRASRGAFTWEVIVKEGVDPAGLFSGLPLKEEERRDREITLRWERGTGDEALP